MVKNLEEIIKCDICNSKKNQFFITSPDRNYGTGKFTFVQCPECKLVWIKIRPTQKVIGGYYPKKYRAYQIPSELSNIQLLVRKLIYNNFLSKFFIKDNLFFEKQKGKILDVGTGNAAYLDILKSWGYEVYGVEINKASVKEARKRGLDVKIGDLFSVKYPKNNFDYIRYSHVLEHVPSPKQELKRTNLLLKKGGKVYIIIPNIGGLFFRIFRSYWYPLEPPRHLYHFYPETIYKLLLETGFKSVKIDYNQSPYTVIRSLMYLLGKKDVEKRYGLLVYPLSVLLRILNLLHLSDTMVITAKK